MEKNRNRNKPSFANINLIGQCNYDCYFCLGKDLQKEIVGVDYLKTHYDAWKNFKEFLAKCLCQRIDQLYITGLNCDPLQYKYLDGLITYLKNRSFFVGLRTNGLLAHKRRCMKIINMCTTCKDDAVGYTFLTLNKDVNLALTGSRKIPDWKKIFNRTNVPFRVSIPFTRFNHGKIYKTLDYLCDFEGIKYIQLRKIATDTRFHDLKTEMKVFEGFKEYLINNAPEGHIRYFELTPYFIYRGKQISLWETVSSSINSINYFCDGKMTDNYFIIEGWKNENQKEENI